MPYNNMVSRSDVAGIVPVEYTNELLTATNEQSAVLRLARRLRDMPAATRTMPVASALSTAYFVNGDTGLKQTTELNWTNETLTAEELAVIVPVSQAVMDDATIDLWAYIRPDLATALGAAIDAAVLLGTNKPASWPAAIVTTATDGVTGNTVAKGAGADLYEDILGESGLVSKIEADGFVMTGALGHVSLRSSLRGVRATTGELIFQSSMQGSAQYMLDGVPIIFPTNGCMSASYPLIVGDWANLVYAMRQDITWKVATEATIQDGSGNIVYNLFQQDMVALRVTMRLGFALPNPVNRINASSTTRYPFAVLTA